MENNEEVIDKIVRAVAEYKAVFLWCESNCPYCMGDNSEIARLVILDFPWKKGNETFQRVATMLCAACKGVELDAPRIIQNLQYMALEFNQEVI